MINDTFELRKKHGKFTQIDSSNLEASHHVANCQACGSNKPELLIAVTANGMTLLVGSTCAGILTSGKNPKVDDNLKGTGEIYKDGDKEYIYITTEWHKNLGDFIYKSGINTNRHGDKIEARYPDYNGAWHTVNHNVFLSNIYEYAKRYGKITVKQYTAVNNSMNK